MPSRLRNRDAIPVDTLHLTGGDFIRYRRFLTAQDRDEINAVLASVDDEGKGSFHLDRTNRATAIQAIVEWGGPGFCREDHPFDDDSEAYGVPEGHTCEPVEVTFENLSILPDPDLRALSAKINSKNPRPVAPRGPLGKGMPAGVN